MVKLALGSRLLIALVSIGAASGCVSVGAQRAFDQGDYLTSAGFPPTKPCAPIQRTPTCCRCGNARAIVS